MIVTIISIVVLLAIVAIVGGVRFIYVAALSKNTQSDMKTKALDVFLYLGIAISLITSVTSILQVLFVAIDRKYPDILNYSGYVDLSQSDVRFAIAALVVMFPIYLGLSWYVARDIKMFLFKQDISVRKIMIYCTLFITVLTLIGTLVSVIYTYLGGELSVRFGLKAMAIFAVALALFAYYYYSLKRDYAKSTVLPLLMTLLATAVVVGTIVWSISIVGSPAQMRAKKIDSTRLSDISGIQGQIFNRIQTTDKLPTNLDELTNAIEGYQLPVDPVTKASYGYRIIQQSVIKMNYTTNKKEMTTGAIFELCASFDTARAIDSRGQSIPTIDKGGVFATDSMFSAANYYYEGDMSPFWNHGVGETCFKRIITPPMYYGR